MAAKRKSRAKPKTVKKTVAAVPTEKKTDRCKDCPWLNPDCPGLKDEQCLREWYAKHNPEVLERLAK